MKIGIDGREFNGNHKTGISRYLENMLLPLIERQDLSFVVYTHPRNSLPDCLARSPAVRLSPLPSWPTLLIDHGFLPKAVVRDQVDVFFSPYCKLPLRGTFKRIMTVHDIMFLRLDEYGAMARWLMACQLKAAVRKADRVLVDSDHSRRELLELIPALADRVVRLYPDLSEEWLQPVSSPQVGDVVRRYAGGKPFLLYVGNFRMHKNVDLLVKAFADLVVSRQASNRVLLLAGGDLKHAARVARLIDTLDMRNHVLVHADVPDPDLRVLYAAAEWFVTASRYEGFGYPVVEAMSAGCPVICCPKTALAEVADAAVVEIPELTVEGIAQALKRGLIMNRQERKQWIERGRQHARLFYPGKASQQFITIVETLVSR